MDSKRRAFFAFTGAFLAAYPVWAQTPVPMRIRGMIEGANAQSITVKTRSGDTTTVKLGDKTRITLISPIDISAIKPGTFIGTAAVTQPDGTLKALEIQVFPESMRGVGEGHRAWDLVPNSTMTNGTVGDLKVNDGRYLTLAYKDGEQKVYVPPNAPVITYSPGTPALLKPGANVIIFATRGTDDTMTAATIGVGEGKLVPPM